MDHERWAKYFATCNTIECFNELTMIAQFYFSVVAHYANVERFFLDAATNLKEREIVLTDHVSALLKLVCNLKIFYAISFKILLTLLR